jgi:hypothetical protein
MIEVPLMAREQAGRKECARKMRLKKYGCGALKAIPVRNIGVLCVNRRVSQPGDEKFLPLSRCRTAQTAPPENINLTSLRQRIIFSAVAPTFLLF